MATLGMRGGVASLSQTSSANGIPQSVSPAGPTVGGVSIDFSQPSTWVGVLYLGALAYLLGAGIMLGRWRVPL